MKNKLLTKLLCFVISIMMIVPAGISFVAAAGEEDPFTALADYGVYSCAGVSGDTTNSLIIDHGASNRYKLFSIDTQAQDALAAGVAQTELNNAKTAGYKYISGVNDGSVSDGAIQYQTKTSGDSVTKDVYFSTKYMRGNPGGKESGGNIYFTVQGNSNITSADTNLTILVEYYDTADVNFGLLYYSTAGNKSHSQKVAAGGTNTWKIAQFDVTDAKFLNGGKTDLGSTAKCDFRIEANGKDTFVSRVMVVKTEDYNKYLAGDLEATDDVVVANAKAALKLDVTEAKANFTLPTVDGVNVVWSSNNSAIAVDGNNAVVTQGAADITVTLTATISKGNVTDTKIFTVTVPAKYKKAAGVEIIIGDSPENDEIEGSIQFDGENTLFEREEPETVTGQNLMIESSGTADFDSMRVKKADSKGTEKWAVYGTKYYQPRREDSGYMRDTNIPFNVEEFTTSDNKVTFEVEYLDNSTNEISFNYISGPDPDGTDKKIPPMTKVSISRTNSGEWMTKTITVTDAYYDNSMATARGKGNKADIRIEGSELYISRVRVYMGAYDELKSAVTALTLDEVYDDNGISVANGYVETDFTLPTEIDDVDGAEVTWSSADDNIIAIDGNTAKINPSEDMRVKTTLTATIVLGEYYAQKSFDITLYKKPKQVVICKEISRTGEGTANAKVEYEISDAGKLIGEDITLILASVDSASDEIKKIGIQTQKVEEEKFTISATVDNISGEIKAYLVDKNGVPLYNAAPSPIKNYRVISGTSGISVMWDAAADDYNAIKKYVIYDGEGNKVDEISGDETSYFVPVKAGETKSYAVEGFDHYGISTGKTEVQSGSLFAPDGITVKLYDLNGEGSNAKMFNDYINNPNTDNHTHEKAMTDVKTNDTLVCRHTINRKSAGLCACGNDCSRTGYTFAYFKPDGKYVTKNTKEVAVIVKYFDYGEGTVNVQYNTVEDYEKTEAKVDNKTWQPGGSYSFELTGTNTFKTHVIKITNACFFSPDALSQADIRFSGGYNGEVYIAELTMIPLENYFEIPTSDVSVAGE